MDSRDPIGNSQPITEDQRDSRGWVRRHPVVTGFLVLIILLVAAVWIAHDQAERALARRIAAIRARGEPVTVQDMVYAQPNIPDDENMVVQLASAGRASMTVKMNEEESKSIPYLGTGRLPPTGERSNDATLSANKAYLARANDALIDLHAALKLQRSNFMVNWKTPAISILMPELSDLRQAGKLLILECQTLAQQGQREKVEQCLIDFVPIIRALDGCDLLIGALVQIANTALIQDAIERSINLVGLSDATLRELQVALRDAESHPDMKLAFFGERVMFLDTLEWARSSGAGSVTGLTSGSTAPGVDRVWHFIPILPELDIAAGLDQYELTLKAIGAPDAVSIQQISSLDAGVQKMPKYCVMSRTLFPSFSRPIVLWVRGIGSNRALRAAIAAERFRLANNRWPEILNDLVPKYLEAVPIDPIDGKPIRYAIIPEGIKTWTICDDDKNEDNGGDVKRLEPRTGNSSKDRPKDYGWVILNPDMRNRPAPTTTQPANSRPTTRGAKK